jgi:hypothetical protein
MAVNNLRAELQKYGKLYKQKFKSELKKDNTYASGRLDRSIAYETKSTNSYSELSLLANSYIEQLSEGRRIGKIPSSTKILDWAKEKGITPEKGGQSESNMKRMAFAIARSIGVRGMIKRYGFKGTGIIDNVYNSLSKQMGDDLFEAYRIDLEKQLKEQVK